MKEYSRVDVGLGRNVSGGTGLAFATRRDGNSEIYVMDADGRHLVRLTENSAVDEAPDWGPGK